MDVRIDLTATHGEIVAAVISVFVGWVCLHLSSGLLRLLAKCADDANDIFQPLPPQISDPFACFITSCQT